MLKNLFFPSVMTIIIYLMHKSDETKKKWYYYILVFSFFLLGGMAISGQLWASPNADMQMKAYQRCLFGSQEALSDADRKYYEEQQKLHWDNAQRNWRNAKNTCILAPDYKRKDILEYIFGAFIGSMNPGTPYQRVVTAVLAELYKYGVDVIEKWDYVCDQMEWCDYHYKMWEFYSNLLATAKL